MYLRVEILYKKSVQKIMNILFVNNIPFNPIAGGLERVTDILAKELVKRGYVVYYLCGKLSSSSLYLLNYDFPAKLFQLPNDGLFDNNDNISFYKKLLSELKIDIVVNQRGLGGWFNNLLPITRSKIISVIHSTPDGDIKFKLSSIDSYTVPPFVNLKKFVKRYVYPIIGSPYKFQFIRDTKRKYNELVQYSDVIVTLSKGDIEVLTRFINVSPKAIITSIPNPNTFKAKEFSSETKSKMVLYVGRLNKAEKNPIRLLKIWKFLHIKYPDWCLKIVGDGPEKTKMQEYVKTHCLTNVFFEGRQSDVAAYYREASFVCLTSNFEGWGMVLTEGMQYGCIPFTFNNYSAAFEIINDNINGCLVPAFNLKKYAYKLSELMSNDAKRIQMSKSAKEKVEQFSVENIVNKWEDLFRKLY